VILYLHASTGFDVCVQCICEFELCTFMRVCKFTCVHLHTALQVAVDTANGELEAGLGGAGLGCLFAALGLTFATLGLATLRFSALARHSVSKGAEECKHRTFSLSYTTGSRKLSEGIITKRALAHV
jgi:hypothetical protein